ncbi:hypothetical protein RCL_jg3831.t1 [Rhizophagus clarus]|uniref:Uncharacterized protein n=1 Tax=Rhizophagus clarus TaxID=94130 RepID=A0A8H3KSL8_9GLOM|nr:hypothetical protein RCL_jg3831.t1 [Rhizophagus clarus]
MATSLSPLKVFWFFRLRVLYSKWMELNDDSSIGCICIERFATGNHADWDIFVNQAFNMFLHPSDLDVKTLGHRHRTGNTRALECNRLQNEWIGIYKSAFLEEVGDGFRSWMVVTFLNIRNLTYA